MAAQLTPLTFYHRQKFIHISFNSKPSRYYIQQYHHRLSLFKIKIREQFNISIVQKFGATLKVANYARKALDPENPHYSVYKEDCDMSSSSTS